VVVAGVSVDLVERVGLIELVERVEAWTWHRDDPRQRDHLGQPGRGSGAAGDGAAEVWVKGGQQGRPDGAIDVGSEHRRQGKGEWRSGHLCSSGARSGGMIEIFIARSVVGLELSASSSPPLREPFGFGTGLQGGTYLPHPADSGRVLAH
jgi:hypothetical protein